MNITIQPEDLDILPSAGRREPEYELADDLGLCSEETKRLLFRLARASLPQNVNVLSDDERMIIGTEVKEITQARLRRLDNLATKYFRRCARILLSLKKSEDAKRSADTVGGLKHFKAPPLKFPKLELADEFRSRTEEDTIKAYRWASSTRYVMLVNNVPNSVGLEMARRNVPQSILVDVEHAMELEEFFILVFGTCPKASLAIDYIRKKLTVDYEGGVIQDGVSDANSVVHKAMTVMRRLNDISCISPIVDISPSDVNIILQTFGTNYGGTAENLQDLMIRWRRKYAEDDSLLITQLKRKVDNIRKNAYDRTALEKRGGTGNQPFQVVNKVHEAVKRQEKRIAAIETFQSGEGYRAREKPQGGGSAPIRGLTCWVCGGSHAVATCQIVVDRRDNNVPLPADVCELCLHKKVPGVRHAISKTDGCHIGSASLRQRRIQNDHDLKRDNLCYEHKMSLTICECYKSTAGGKKPNTAREPRYIKGQGK